MVDIKKSIKKIGAIGAISIVGLAPTFAAFNTYSFPQSFIEDGEFVGDIVVGTDAPLDRSIAESLIEMLQEGSDEGDMVKITYRGGEMNGERIDAASRGELNYGETLGMVSESRGFDDGDLDLLADGEFDNGISDEDYEQTLTLLNGEFNYALRDEVDGIEEIMDGIFYEDGDEFAVYTLNLDSPIDLTDTDDLDGDMIGSELTIMGNEFTISSISRDGADLDELELIGGANRISIEEGETQTITIDDRTYEIYVRIVSGDSVSLEVNGQGGVLDLFDSDDLGGINIAVTDMIESSRDSIGGFVEIVIGGQKITLEDDGAIVQIDEEDVDDVFEDYEITSDFSDGDNGMDVITITYKVNDDILLQEGDQLEDVLFDTFAIRFEGINDVTYETVEFESDDELVSLSGVHVDGDDFSRDVLFTSTTDGSNGVTYMISNEDDDKRLFFQGSDLGIFMPAGISLVNNDTIELNFSDNDLEGNGFLFSEDIDEQYWYEVTNVDSSDNSIDLEEIFREDTIDEVETDEFEGEIEPIISGLIGNFTTSTLELNLDSFGDPFIAFENELMVDLSNVESASGINGSFRIFLNDVNGDNSADEEEDYEIFLGWDSGDDKITFSLDKSDSDFVNQGLADSNDNNDDTQIYVTAYGTRIEFDNDEGEFVRISVPDEQIEAQVDLIFGNIASDTSTIFVDPDEVDSTVEDLEDRGFEIISVEEPENGVIINGNATIDFSNIEIMTADEVDSMENKIILGGPAVNSAAAEILGVDFPTFGPLSELNINEAVVRYYDSEDALLIYGYNAEDTEFAIEELLDGGISQRETMLNR